MMKQKIVLVTGGSSGIGLETAKALRDRGCTVYEMSRREAQEPGISHITGDVTVRQDADHALRRIAQEQGRLDILINNAGFGISGCAELTDPADAARQMQVNFLGCANMCSAALPLLRESGGRIVNLSSVAAVTPIPFQAFYSASKAAINAYTMALANEVKPFHVSVCAVMPGDIKTGFTAARKKEPAGDGLYGGRISRSVARMERDEQNGMSAASAGAYISKIALKRRVKPLYAIRADYKAIVLLAKLLPAALLNWLIGLLYAK